MKQKKKYNISNPRITKNRRYNLYDKEKKILIFKHSIGVENLSTEKAHSMIIQYRKSIENIFDDLKDYNVKNFIVGSGKPAMTVDVELIYPILSDNRKLSSNFDFDSITRKLKIFNFLKDYEEDK